jgi:hypothetical protein
MIKKILSKDSAFDSGLQVETIEDLLVWYGQKNTWEFRLLPETLSEGEIDEYLVRFSNSIQDKFVLFNQFHRFVPNAGYAEDDDGYVKFRIKYLHQMFGSSKHYPATISLESMVASLVDAELVSILPETADSDGGRIQRIKLSGRYNSIVDSVKFDLGGVRFENVCRVIDKWQIQRHSKWTDAKFLKVNDEMRGMLKEKIERIHVPSPVV